MKETLTKTPTTTMSCKMVATAPPNANEKLEIVTLSATKNPTPTKANKIFTWLKSATKTFDSIDSHHPNDLIKNRLSDSGTYNIACESVKPAQINGFSAKLPDATLRDFRGVQSLRHLWNKRISASEESSSASSPSNCKVGKLTKSISCLVSAINTSDSRPQSNKSDDLAIRRRVQTKRAQSLHDCSRLDHETNELTETEINKLLLHREKDNFYKYKTAEQAGKHFFVREPKVRTTQIRVSAGIASVVSMGADAKFPSIETSERGERIHWLKRQDIVLKRKEARTAVPAITKNAIRDEKYTADNATSLSANSDVGDDFISTANLQPKQTITATKTESNQSECQSVSSSTSSDTLRATPTKSPQNGSRTRITERVASTSSLKRGSTDSLGSNGGRSTPRKNLGASSSNSAARKYSFKTHARAYHAPRKMTHSSKDGSGGGSMVAKLTQQFNEIVQKDKKLLEEVKRKKGVLMSRGGHIYKVVENTEHLKSNSPSVSRNGSLARDKAQRPISTVQRNIKKFENGVRVDGAGKPKVPLKSLYVLRKRNDIATKKQHQTSKRTNLDATAKLEMQINDAPSILNEEETKTIGDINAEKPAHLVWGFSTYDATAGVASTKVISNEQQTVNSSDQQKAETKTNAATECITKTPTALVADNDLAKNAAITLQTEALPTPPTNTSSSASIKTNLAQTEPTNDNDKLASELKQSVVKSEIIADAQLQHHNENYAEVTTNGNVDVVDLDCMMVDDEKEKPRKTKYAKIYEKFRFRSPFGGSSGSHSKKSTPSSSPEKQLAVEMQTAAEVITTAEPEAKILDALQQIDQKLKCLSSGEDDKAPIIVAENDDFEQRVLPNNSFVFQSSAKQVSNNQLIVTQAVNVVLVNALQGGQMALAQNVQSNAPKVAMLAVNKDNTDTDTTAQPLYEPVSSIKIDDKTESFNQSQTCVFKSSTLAKSSSSLQSEEDIYQTVDESHLLGTKVATQQTTTTKADATAAANVILNDYESIAGSCEQTTPAPSATKSLHDDGYEVCEPPPPPPQPLPLSPAEESLSLTTNASSPAVTILRNTTDELPELPKPQRRLPKSPMPGKRLPKPVPAGCSIVRVPSPTTTAATNSLLNDDSHDQDYNADDENIYDTIKGSECYESLHADCIKSQKMPKKYADSVSLTSNCYESITHYRRIVITNHNGGHAVGHSNSGSTLTISSDHNTNSLYEGSLAAGLLYNGTSHLGYAAVDDTSHLSHVKIIKTSGGGGSIRESICSSNGPNYAPSIAASNSDNSDEWIDITDTEDMGITGGAASDQLAKQQFIVVRERSKAHRSPDWSKRVRDKRLHQKKAMSSELEDDSDHYYETLSPLSQKRISMQHVQRTNSIRHPKRNQDLPRYPLGASQRSKKQWSSAHVLGNGVSDDYDSFDTDTDEICSADKNQNDSGVDMHNSRLPEPPPTTNQVYAMVKKFKNFISNKKSSHKHGGSQQKLYENTSQFYVEGNIYEDAPKIKTKTHKTKAKLPAPVTPLSQSDSYENSDFHAPPALKIDSPPLNESEGSSSKPGITAVNTPRAKSKIGKSFKSRLRKSLVGTLENKELSTLMPTRSTFYIEDPTQEVGSGELDSGFSEKASSGDLPIGSDTSPQEEVHKSLTMARKTKKDTKITHAQRRRTTIGMRPHEPPPPPPEDIVKARHLSAVSTTSWYAECGVFKNGAASIQPDESLSGSKTTLCQNGSTSPNVSWYTEAGLYQTSGVSVASSSGSSGVSTGNECGLGDDLPHSMFLNEPLYQIYSAAKLESISRDMEDHDGSTDGYEEIGQNNGAAEKAEHSRESEKRSRPTALQLVEPKNGPSRTLWSEIPEVINSCILLTLTPRERGLQEAKFEIVTSEASYLKSLNLLRSHFMNHPLFRDTSVVSARDRKALFSYIVPVHECSERLLTELESCWQDNIMLLGLSKRIYAIAEKYFHVYIAFCEHQGRMDRTLRRLKEVKGIFSQNLDLIEANPICCGLNLHSFLMLPMQRITRLPLLVDAVFSKVSPQDDEYDNWKMTLAIMNKIVAQCNDAANRCEQAYEIERISRQLEFPSSIRALAIAPVGVALPGAKPRFLVKKGELTHLIWRGDDAKLTFGKKFIKTSVYAFLFSDLLVLTKRKNEHQFHVFDYCPRNMLTISSGDTLPQLPTKEMTQSGKNLILMTLLENHERKTVELVLSCPSVSDQQRWLQAMRPPEAETPGEKLYEQWDCPQVIVKHSYVSNEPDVLSLEMGDVVNVTRKLLDGWFQGERIRDGAVGWFPGSYTEEVNSVHVRARNLKQRYRLLTFTATYLESQKKK